MVDTQDHPQQEPNWTEEQSERNIEGQLERTIEMKQGQRRKQCCSTYPRSFVLNKIYKTFLSFYMTAGGAITYALLLIVICTTGYSINPDLVKPPICRKVWNSHTTLNSLNQTTPLNRDYISPPSTYLVCKNGDLLSVLVFYGFGFILGEVMELLHLPGLLGMLLGGLTLRNIGTFMINETIFHEGTLPNNSHVIDGKVFASDGLFSITDSKTQFAALLHVNPALSGILRQLALAIILTRAGLGLDPSTLKQVFGSVFRLAFIPCISEAFCIMILTRFLIAWPWVWGAILGFVCAAVSPAVIVPNMMRLEITGWGVAEGIPTLVVAAASIDDVLAITGFGVALAVALNTNHSVVKALISGPAEVLLGTTFGAVVGLVICLFPPPKLEHSHFLRGTILICLAVTGILGSTVIQLPGAGALSCLTLAFTVAKGWRAGWPWKLTQPEVFSVFQETAPVPCELTTLKDKISKRKNTKFIKTHKTSQCEDASSENDLKLNAHQVTLPDTPRRKVTPSNGFSILEALVEYHPYYCSILRQQYHSSLPRHKNTRLNSSLAKNITSIARRGDLPAIAVAVAATGTDARKISTVQPLQTFKHIRHKTSRRFSLPEPTAHYELESFTATGVSSRYVSRSSVATKRVRNPSRTEFKSPEECCDSNMSAYDQTTETLEQIVEVDTDNSDIVRTGSQFHASHSVAQSSEQFAPMVSLPATPRERGLECVNSMRQTLAAAWWFVQPILFTLIGSEVNLSRMAGQSIGSGFLALVIALFFRLGVTILAVMPSKLNMKERLFVGFSWLPKATVQAAVGPVALDTARKLNASSEILAHAEQVVTLAALAILLTAPLGAFLMPLTAPYLLRQDTQAADAMLSKFGTTDTSETTGEAKSTLKEIS